MKKAVILLFLMNLLALGLIFHLMTRSNEGEAIALEESAPEEETGGEVLLVDTVIKELPDNASIAYFFMDTVTEKYLLMAEHIATARKEESRLEGEMQAAARKADARYKQLMTMDDTYLTMEEKEQYYYEAQNLLPNLEKKRMAKEEEMARLQMSMLAEITKNITDFLADYNEVQNLDFIYSIQNEGQIWVGNEGLDITEDVIRGLNLRYRRDRKGEPVDSLLQK